MAEKQAVSRINVVGSHMASPSQVEEQRKRILQKRRPNNIVTQGKVANRLTREIANRLQNKSESMLDGHKYNVAHELHGPLRDDEDKTVTDVLMDIDGFNAKGEQHHYWVQTQHHYANGDMGANICIPIVAREPRSKPYITNMVILSDPDDCERIARVHVKKQPNFQLFGFFHSIISTDDTDFWRHQREHFAEAFLPDASLAKILPVTLARASKCAERLQSMLPNADNEIDMSEFLLHETLAQLQLALMGESEEFMERTNKPFRKAFNAQGDNPTYVRDFIVELTDRMVENVGDRTLPNEAQARGCPVRGPLGRAMGEFESDYTTRFGNGLIFAFAGHDTTGHTLSWLLLELSKHPEYQDRLRAEVMQFVDNHNGDLSSVEYLDFKQLPFMTRCIMETLRLWPAVANGTFRTLMFDDVCKGPAGSMVRLPKGTYVQVSTWSRHRNPELWGPDAHIFNPDREFRDNELWDGTFAAYNPASKRFSPFTYNPRHCIGMNFAHMEMRAILLNLLRKFEFSLGAAAAQEKVVSINRGTLGPSCGRAAKLGVSKDLLGPNQSSVRPNGLFLKVTPL
eukprot:m.6667 g.6667  ORF g.6667 m.6667 type:complete len:570 (+) comp3566_c0_seq1:71-1780(+)